MQRAPVIGHDIGIAGHKTESSRRRKPVQHTVPDRDDRLGSFAGQVGREIHPSPIDLVATGAAAGAKEHLLPICGIAHSMPQCAGRAGKTLYITHQAPHAVGRQPGKGWHRRSWNAAADGLEYVRIAAAVPEGPSIERRCALAARRSRTMTGRAGGFEYGLAGRRRRRIVGEGVCDHVCCGRLGRLGMGI